MVAGQQFHIINHQHHLFGVCYCFLFYQFAWVMHTAAIVVGRGHKAADNQNDEYTDKFRLHVIKFVVADFRLLLFFLQH